MLRVARNGTAAKRMPARQCRIMLLPHPGCYPLSLQSCRLPA
jgi:hypothetical protein